MRYWDSSAILAITLRESGSPALLGMADEDPRILTWWGSRTECLGAIARAERAGRLDPEALRLAREGALALFAGAEEIGASERLRSRADRLVWVHPLRAADAFQLAAAIEWCEDHAAGVEFASLDERLRESARREGFRVVPTGAAS